MALSPDQADLMLTLYSGTVEDVPAQAPQQLQRLYFKTQLIRVRGVGNEFQKTQNDSYKGEREMSICEMERNADSARKAFQLARKELINNINLAKRRKVKLDKQVLETRTTEPLTVGIGKAYCSLLTKTGVKELAAQTPVQQDTVKARTDSIRASIEAESRKQRDSVGAVVPPAPAAPVQAPATNAPAATTRPTKPAVIVQPPSAQAPAQVPAPVPGGPPPSSGVETTEASQNQPDEVIPSQAEGARLRVIETLRSLNRYEVEIQKKFALAAACFIFVLLGAPIALRFPRAGVGLTIGVSLVVFGLYYVGLIAGESLARRGLMPPFVSMWLANVLFGVIALILLARMGKEAGSSRSGDFSEMIENLRYRFKRRSSPAAPRSLTRTSAP